jgi:NAD(P)-dependent dehydrogenase (short-subunit alcohol dehydrogenase family)
VRSIFETKPASLASLRILTSSIISQSRQVTGAARCIRRQWTSISRRRATASKYASGERSPPLSTAATKIAPNGSITLTSGMLAHRPRKGAPLATAIGGAVEHLVHGLAIDLAPVRVNAVCPGITLTERQMSEEMLRTYVARLPLPRGASPTEAATAYVYLMLNSYTTGQILPVDGGGGLV